MGFVEWTGLKGNGGLSRTLTLGFFEPVEAQGFLLHYWAGGYSIHGLFRVAPRPFFLIQLLSFFARYTIKYNKSSLKQSGA